VSETPKAFVPLEVSQNEDPYAFMQRVFVYFLQSLFEHEEFQGTGMYWTPNEETTEMVISSEKPRVEVLEKTPHITVVLGTAQWSGLSIDQMQSMSMRTGERTHTDLVAMTVAYHCQAKEGNQARRMAWYSTYYTNMFRRMLMRQAKIHQIGSGHTISAESAPSAYVGQLSNDELVSVVATIPFYWQPQWRVRTPAPLAERFRFNFNLGQRVRPLTVRGRPVVSTPIDRSQVSLRQRGLASEE
jgi:hypothetical protein